MRTPKTPMAALNILHKLHPFQDVIVHPTHAWHCDDGMFNRITIGVFKNDLRSDFAFFANEATLELAWNEYAAWARGADGTKVKGGSE